MTFKLAWGSRAIEIVNVVDTALMLQELLREADREMVIVVVLPAQWRLIRRPVSIFGIDIAHEDCPAEYIRLAKRD
jgi:hypothetical protein